MTLESIPQNGGIEKVSGGKVHAEKLATVGRLTAGMAHQVNNHLMGVLTFAHLMRDKSHMDELDREDLGLIIHETTQAAALVRELLDFARDQPVQMRPINLNDLVQQTVRLVSYQKSFGHVTIQEVLQENLPEVRGDRNLLQQTLLSLLLHAFDAMPGGGSLTIQTASADDKIGVLVRNGNANGETPAPTADAGVVVLPPIVQPKEQHEKQTDGDFQAAIGIMKQHGGELKTLSNNEQNGRRDIAFSLVFPPMHW
jgi:signal transduction histidine kinase